MRKFVASVALATVVAVGGLLGAVPAKAATLIGETLTATYFFPDTSTEYTATGGFPQSFIAGSTTVTDTFPSGPFFTVSATASNIIVTMLQSQIYDPSASFDGLKISGILPTIIG